MTKERKRIFYETVIDESEMINALCFDIDDLAYGLNVKTGTALPQQYLVEKETYALLELLEELT